MRRLDIPADEYYLLKPGEYMKGSHNWWARTPANASFQNGAVANLGHHEVIEHDDGTITVSPSILVTGGGSWHGFLERGSGAKSEQDGNIGISVVMTRQ